MKLFLWKNSMASTPEQLFSFFDELGIKHSTVEHPPVFTVEEASAWYDRIPGLHCKNLFLKDKKDKIWLAVMPAEKRANLEHIQKQVGAARFSFGKPELLREVLGVVPGSVTPFGLINDTEKRVAVVLDEDLLRAEQVNFHPLHNAASTTIRAKDLVRFVEALHYVPLIVNCGSQ
jgi:Ala-tRNA(Pro) deacylase